MRFGKLTHRFMRAVEARERLFEARKIGQYMSAIVMSLGKVGVERERAIEGDERLVEALQIPQGIAAIVEQEWVLRIDLYRPVDELDACRKIPRLSLDHTKEAQCFGILRIVRHDLAVQRRSFREPALSIK